MSQWQPIETCPENTWVFLWRPWQDAPHIAIGKFYWIDIREWETVSESSGASGARRQIRQETVRREREWEPDGASGDLWAPLLEPPAQQPDTT